MGKFTADESGRSQSGRYTPVGQASTDFYQLYCGLKGPRHLKEPTICKLHWDLGSRRSPPTLFCADVPTFNRLKRGFHPHVRRNFCLLALIGPVSEHPHNRRLAGGAGGVGLNITKALIATHGEVWWSRKDKRISLDKHPLHQNFRCPHRYNTWYFKRGFCYTRVFCWIFQEAAVSSEAVGIFLSAQSHTYLHA